MNKPIEKYNLQKMVGNNDTLFAHVFLECGRGTMRVALKCDTEEYKPDDVEVEVKLNGISVRVADFEALMLDFVERKLEQRKEEIVGVTQEDIDALVKAKLQSLIDYI